MPTRRTKQVNDRPTSYAIPKSSKMTAVLGPSQPMSSWSNMSGHASTQPWQPHMQQYQPQTTIAEYSQSFQAPSVVVQAPPTPAADSASTHSRRQSTSRGVARSDNAWTEEMDNVLIEAQARGMKWESIAKEFFPSKSANACRKRFGRARDERRASEWDDRKIAKLVAAYNREGVREQIWGVLSRETGERWQTIERLCFSQGYVKMTRARTGHVRRPSHKSISQPREDIRYHASSNDEYDGNEDSGIGLGPSAPHTYHPGTISQAPASVSNRGLSESLMHPTQHYIYRP